MTDIEMLIKGLEVNQGVGPIERDVLEKILENYELRLSRIEKALRIEPLSEEEKKAAAQERWFANSEPWREELRKARRE